MQFNAFRLMFKYDSKVAINVMHATDPQVLCAAFVKQQAFSRNPKNK